MLRQKPGLFSVLLHFAGTFHLYFATILIIDFIASSAFIGCLNYSTNRNPFDAGRITTNRKGKSMRLLPNLDRRRTTLTYPTRLPR